MTDLDKDLGEFLNRVQLQRRAYEQEKAKAFRQHIGELIESGIVTVVCRYSGYGDSGGVEDVEYLGADNKNIPRGVVAHSVDGEVRNYAESLLPMGFEINDGSQGTVTLDLVKRTYSLQHDQNVIEVMSSGENGTF